MTPLNKPISSLLLATGLLNSTLPFIPEFDRLPSCEGTPQGCAWGVFDNATSKDVYGTLNLLTSDAIRSAKEEVVEGISMSLNWNLDAYPGNSLNRKQLNNTFLNWQDTGLLKFGWDEEISFNTQITSHWDSYCHFPHQVTGLTYNGAKCTPENLANSTTGSKNLPTLDQWQLRGGVVGRGVLLDYYRYAEAKGIKISPFSYHPITVQTLEDVAHAQDTELRAGDILIIRTGFVKALSKLTKEEQLNATRSGESIGLEPSRDMARWIWNRQFSAVAGDNAAVEATLVPGVTSNNDFPNSRELWELEGLSQHCQKTGKYSFLLTSIPLNVPGMIAGPPNAIAIL